MEGPAHAEIEEAVADLSIQHGTRFAIAVFAIMLAEQTLMNAAVLIVNASSGEALAGFVFNVLLIVRAPLQLFQAIQTSILPHLAGLEARASGEEFARAIRITVLAIAGFAGACALGLLAIGPWVMSTLLGDKGFTYERGGLALVALGMGFHLIAGTLNQAALARRRAGLAAAAWLLCAALFVAWVVSPIVDDEVLRVETGYFGAAFLAQRAAARPRTGAPWRRRRAHATGVPLLVRERLEHVELRRAARRPDRGDHAEDRGEHEQDHELQRPGSRS